MLAHEDGSKSKRKSATTGDMALKNIIAGGPQMIQKVRIEHRAVFVKLFVLKRATLARPNPTTAESHSGSLSNVVGGECVAPWRINNQQTI